MSSPQEVEIIQRVLQGEIEYFEDIVKRYQGSLFNFAFRVTLDREAARDITQDTFIAAYENLSQFKGEGKFLSWLYRIITNKCINFRKRRKRIFFQPLESCSYGLADPLPNPESECEKREAVEMLYRGMERLSADQRAALNLFYITGYSYQEVGEILGISEAKLKSDLFRARQSLRKYLEGLKK